MSALEEAEFSRRCGGTGPGAGPAAGQMSALEVAELPDGAHVLRRSHSRISRCWFLVCFSGFCELVAVP